MGAELIVSPGEFLSTSENAAPSLEPLPQLPSQGCLGFSRPGEALLASSPSKPMGHSGNTPGPADGSGDPPPVPRAELQPHSRSCRQGGEGRAAAGCLSQPAHPAHPGGTRAEPPTLQAPLLPSLRPSLPCSVAPPGPSCGRSSDFLAPSCHVPLCSPALPPLCWQSFSSDMRGFVFNFLNYSII